MGWSGGFNGNSPKLSWIDLFSIWPSSCISTLESVKITVIASSSNYNTLITDCPENSALRQRSSSFALNLKVCSQCVSILTYLHTYILSLFPIHQMAMILKTFWTQQKSSPGMMNTFYILTTSAFLVDIKMPYQLKIKLQLSTIPFHHYSPLCFDFVTDYIFNNHRVSGQYIHN